MPRQKCKIRLVHLRRKHATNPEDKNQSEDEYINLFGQEEIIQEVKAFYCDLYAERENHPVSEEIVSALGARNIKKLTQMELENT